METTSKQSETDWDGAFYHVYNRGVEKRRIFEDDKDHQRFLQLLLVSNAERHVHLSNVPYQGRTLINLSASLTENEPLVAIGAYCLMPNHFHLLVRELKEGGLSKFIQKFSTGFTMYFNRKYDRTGALFQGKYKAKLVNSDEYLKYLLAYIHLNPIELFQPDWRDVGIRDENAAREHLFEYKRSSYLDYLGHDREEKIILGLPNFPEYFSKPADFSSFIEDWLLYRAVGELT